VRWRVEVAARRGALALEVAIEGDHRPTVLIGPNGAGKTTLLRLIAGARRPQRGLIRVGERSLFDAAAGVDLPPEERRIGYVPQGCGLFPHLPAVDNVAFGLAARGVPRAARRRTARAMLERLDAGHLAERRPAALSGGEAQRVALARALVVEPDLLLLDEPLAALDASSRRAARAFLAGHLAVRGRPALVVTHDPRDVAALGGTVVAMERGRVVQVGAAADLRARPTTDFVAEFFDAAAGAPPG
jgi:ABC-type sulfate/molybdate transport systems ATPase subunit